MSLWEPWNRWLVTSCDIESSRAWATCKVPHGYLDHHNAATDDDVNWCSCFFRPGWSDPWGRRQPSQPCTSRTAVATSPTAFGSQRIWDTVLFLSNTCRICNVQDIFHRSKKPFLLSQNIFPFAWKKTRLKILNIWLRLRSDNFWLPTKLTAVVCTPIDLNFDSMNKKGFSGKGVFSCHFIWT